MMWVQLFLQYRKQTGRDELTFARFQSQWTSVLKIHVVGCMQTPPSIYSLLISTSYSLLEGLTLSLITG